MQDIWSSGSEFWNKQIEIQFESMSWIQKYLLRNVVVVLTQVCIPPFSLSQGKIKFDIERERDFISAKYLVGPGLPSRRKCG